MDKNERKRVWKRILQGPPSKMERCPRCGDKVARLGGGWFHRRISFVLRVEFCLNPVCGWCRKLVRAWGVPNKDFKEVR